VAPQAGALLEGQTSENLLRGPREPQRPRA
jgi:hypothetical protein